MENSTVVGVFADRSAAHSAVAALEAAGFTHEHIGFVGHGDPAEHGSGDGHAEAKGALAGASRGSLTGAARSAASWAPSRRSSSRGSAPSSPAACWRASLPAR